VIDNKILLKHAPAAKKKESKKNIKNVMRYRESRSAKGRKTR